MSDLCVHKAALDAIMQGSTSRAYGIKYTTQTGAWRASIALTPEQQELLRAAADYDAKT